MKSIQKTNDRCFLDFWQNNISWIAELNSKMYLAMCDDKTTNTVGPNSTTMAFDHRVGNIVQIANQVLSQIVWILHLNVIGLRNKHWQLFPAGVVPALLHPMDQKDILNLPRKIPHQLLTRAHLISTSLMARVLKEKQGCPGPIGRSPSREIYKSSYMCNIQNCRTKDWQDFWNMFSRITVNVQNDLTHHV